MKDYTFDVTLHAAITIEAESEEEAIRILKCDAATAYVFYEIPDVEPQHPDLAFEVSCSESDMTLVAVDGEEPVPGEDEDEGDQACRPASEEAPAGCAAQSSGPV
jgi:hypothetical protein